MKPETWTRVRELFDAAAALPPGERTAWLERACAGEPEVKAELERLLREDDAAHGFLETSALERADLALGTPLRAGARVGRYRLVREIASGGMGTVFEALQDQPRRTVAVKMLRFGLASPERLRRFQVEAEVLGTLTHPGIAQIFEADTVDGQPWFAMEYVAGARDLVAFAREQGLGARERVRLFTAVCDAVAHGHQKGVIHRDLKPSNVLVDEAGRPKVIDFGVARAAQAGPGAGGALETRAGNVVGTLPYMSPEQLAADGAAVDVRSDVYSLGCMLCELLSGRLPHDLEGLSLAAVAQRVLEEEPSVPAALPSELRWILLRALEKDADRRYASASELRADLERFLAGEPVLAGPPSRRYRLQRLARRNRGALLALLLVFAALAVGLVRARIDARAAERARVAADEARRAAEREASRARAVTAFLRRTLTSIAPADMGPEVRVLDVLEEAERSVTRGALEPDALATVHHVLGESYLALGDLERAEAHLALARSPGWRASAEPLALDAEASWATLLVRQRRFADALALTAELLALAEARQGAGSQSALSVREARVRALTGLDRFDEAEPLALANLELADALPADEVLARAYCLADLAALRRAQGRFDEQLELLRRELALCEERLPAEHFLTQATRMAVGSALFDLTRWKESEELLRPALEWSRRRLGEHHQTLAALNNVSIALLMQDRPLEALDLIEEALPLARRLHGEGSLVALRVLTNLAVARVKEERFGEAEAVCLEILAQGTETLESDPDLLLRVRMNLGMALEGQGRLDEAEELYRANWEQSRARIGAAHRTTLAHLARLVYVNHLQGDHAEVLRTARELRDQERPGGPYAAWSRQMLDESSAPAAMPE